MQNKKLSKWSYFLVLALLSGALGQDNDSIKNIKSNLISRINQVEPDSKTKESLRDIYVQDLAMTSRDLEDPAVVLFFLDIISKDKNEWVQLEAAADIHLLKIPGTLEEKVTRALEKCQKDERINFQVLASISRIQLAKKKHRVDEKSVKLLARISRGEGMNQWKIMVPLHNIGMMVEDPTTKQQIPFEESSKIGMRSRALYGLAISKDSLSRKVISEMENDKNGRVREQAKGLLEHIEEIN